MHAKLDSGPDFEDVSKQIGKNVDTLRWAGRVKCAKDEFPLNRSEIICDLSPVDLQKDLLTFNLDAYQHTERFIQPYPPGLILVDASKDDGSTIFGNVNLDQLVLSGITNRRAEINLITQESTDEWLKIARAKSSSDGAGDFKKDARRIVSQCLKEFPKGSDPTDEELASEGPVTREQYLRLFQGKRDKDFVILEIAKAELKLAEQDEGFSIQQRESKRAQQLAWLDEMEGKIINKIEYNFQTRANPLSLLHIRVTFKD